MHDTSCLHDNNCDFNVWQIHVPWKLTFNSQIVWNLIIFHVIYSLSSFEFLLQKSVFYKKKNLRHTTKCMNANESRTYCVFILTAEIYNYGNRNICK